jgi:hypothetical protein
LYNKGPCGRFHKYFFGVIYVARGILPDVLNQVTPLGV